MNIFQTCTSTIIGLAYSECRRSLSVSEQHHVSNEAVPNTPCPYVEEMLDISGNKFSLQLMDATGPTHMHDGELTPPSP